MYVLSIDPSLTGFGWVVVRGMRVVACGCIKTEAQNKVLRIRKGDDDVARISFINSQLKDVFDKYPIKYITAELPGGNTKSANAAGALGMVKAMVQTTSDYLSIPIEWYSEGDAKMNLHTRRDATKLETIKKITPLFKGNYITGVKYKDEAVCDALSVYYCAVKQSNILKV